MNAELKIYTMKSIQFIVLLKNYIDTTQPFSQYFLLTQKNEIWSVSVKDVIRDIWTSHYSKRTVIGRPYGNLAENGLPLLKLWCWLKSILKIKGKCSCIWIAKRKHLRDFGAGDDKKRLNVSYHPFMRVARKVEPGRQENDFIYIVIKKLIGI